MYDVRLRDADCREYSKTFLTKREAEASELAERTARNRGVWIDPRLASIRAVDVAGVWITANSTKRPGSIARDQSVLENHILPVLGSRPVGSVTRADVQQLVNGWAASHAPSSTVRMYAVLRAVMSFAEDSELIARSPCLRIRVPQLTPRSAEILDAEALGRLAGAMGPHGPMVYLGAFGLRWGEIAGLRVNCVDFLRYAITVDGQVTRGLKGRMIESDPKTRAGRRLALGRDDLLPGYGTLHAYSTDSTFNLRYGR